MTPRPILITAFQPFGRSGRLRGRNASAEVLDLLRRDRRLTGACIQYSVLAVSGAGIAELRRLIADLRPRALLALGEHGRLGPGEVVLEPYAHVAPVIGRRAAHRRDPRLISRFAVQELRARRRPARSEIGYYYCNAAYRAALEALPNRAPAAFLHISVYGRPRDKAAKAGQILRAVIWRGSGH